MPQQTHITADGDVSIQVGISGQAEDVRRARVLWAWVDSRAWAGLPAGARAVGLALVRAAHLQNTRAGARLRSWPPVRELGLMAGLTKRPVQAALAQLRDAGLVRLVEEGGGTTTTTTIHELIETPETFGAGTVAPGATQPMLKSAPVLKTARVLESAPVLGSAGVRPNDFGFNPDSSVLSQFKTDDDVDVSSSRLDFDREARVRVIVESEGTGDPDFVRMAERMADMGDMRTVVNAVRNANSARRDGKIRSSWRSLVESGIKGRYPLYESLARADQRVVAAAIRGAMFPAEFWAHVTGAWAEESRKVRNDQEAAQVILRMSGVTWIQTPKPEEAARLIVAAVLGSTFAKG